MADQSDAVHARWGRFLPPDAAEDWRKPPFAARDRILPGRPLPTAEGRGDALVLASGWAAEIRHLPGSRRHVLSLLLPGDVVPAETTALGVGSTELRTLTEVAIVDGAILAAARKQPSKFPQLASALARGDLEDRQLLREQLIRLGALNAQERMAHFVLEMRFRAERAGLLRQASFELPITQSVIGDYIGISSVHANRCLRAMQDEEFFKLTSRQLTLLDTPRLKQLAQFAAPDSETK